MAHACLRALCSAPLGRLVGRLLSGPARPLPPGGARPAAKPTKTQAEYQAIQERHPGSLVFYQIGDFYELYGDQAHEFSRIAGVQLCRRAEESSMPMTGFPVRSLDAFLAKALRAGKRVVLVDQHRRAAGERTQFERRVSRVITAGTAFEEALVERGAFSYLLAIRRVREGFSLCWADLSVGSIQHAVCSEPSLERMVILIGPSEAVVDEESRRWAASLERRGVPVTLYSRDAERAEASSLFVDEVEPEFLGNKAFSLLAGYLVGEGICRARIFQPPRRFNESAVMLLDESTVAALDLLPAGGGRASLFALLDRCLTGLGSRLLGDRLRYPSTVPEEISVRLELQQAVSDLGAQNHRLLRDVLRRMPDFERSLQRLLIRKEAGAPKDLATIFESLHLARELVAQLEGMRPAGGAAVLVEYLISGLSSASGLHEGRKMLAPQPPLRASDGNLILPGCDPLLDSLLAEMEALNREAELYKNALRMELLQSCGAKCQVVTKDAREWFVESNRSLDHSDLRFRSLSGKSQHRYQLVSEEALGLSGRIAALAEKIVQQEVSIFESAVGKVCAAAAALKALAFAVSELDLALAIASFGFSRPLVARQPEAFLRIRGGRHPVLEAVQAAQLRNFVPNDCDVGAGDLLFITGPNMGGKSTFLKQAALIAIMAQAGLFVPAERASLSPFDGVFCRMGAGDAIARDQSTFMVELAEVKNILDRSTKNSLVLLDELGRGTDYHDGAALAAAICSHLKASVGCTVLFSSHYHLLPRVLPPSARCLCSTATVAGGRLVLSHKILPGVASCSFGLEVAALAGLPPSVLEAAASYRQAISNPQPAA